MIPKIIVTTSSQETNTLIDQIAIKHNIAPSDRIIVQPEKEGLTVEQIHVLQKDIQVAFSQMVLVVLIGVDASSVEVQNSLLKSIEEDSERILFVFLVQNPALLLPTILSRCTVSGVAPITRHTENTHDIRELFSFKNNTDVTKEEAIAKIDLYIQSSSQINPSTLTHILTMRSLIINNNMNPVLALDNILLFTTKNSTMRLKDEK